jgi:hypothetical protein
MDKILHPLRLFGRPVWAAAITLVLLFGGLFLFKTSSIENDIMIKGAVSLSLRINGTPVAGDKGAIPCSPGDTLEFLATGQQPLYCRVLYQNNDGSLQNCPLLARNSTLACGPENGFLTERIILEKGWKKKNLYCILTGKELPFVEAVFIINRYLRKELTRERPLIETFYLYNIS